MSQWPAVITHLSRSYESSKKHECHLASWLHQLRWLFHAASTSKLLSLLQCILISRFCIMVWESTNKDYCCCCWCYEWTMWSALMSHWPTLTSHLTTTDKPRTWLANIDNYLASIGELFEQYWQAIYIWLALVLVALDLIPWFAKDIY